jgi:aryl-alcohol dehydrogenase-like predicted oxidoreductase
VAFGCWAIGGHGWGPVDDGDSIAAIRRALDLGINFFDTADTYGFGHSETVLAEALGKQRNRVVIATKFGVKWDADGKITRDISQARVFEALDASLRRLKLDCIPLYQIHWPDGRTPISSTLEGLMRCQEAGKVQYIGVSNFPLALILEAQRTHPIVSVQIPYNVVDRKFEATVLPCCKQLGLSVLAYSPLAQGLLTGKYGAQAYFDKEDIRSRSEYFQPDRHKTNQMVLAKLTEMGIRYGKTPSQVAIRWILDRGANLCAITGVKTSEQIEESAGALHWRLSDDDWKLLSITSGGPVVE